MTMIHTEQDVMKTELIMIKNVRNYIYNNNNDNNISANLLNCNSNEDT